MANDILRGEAFFKRRTAPQEAGRWHNRKTRQSGAGTEAATGQDGPDVSCIGLGGYHLGLGQGTAR